MKIPEDLFEEFTDLNKQTLLVACECVLMAPILLGIFLLILRKFTRTRTSFIFGSVFALVGVIYPWTYFQMGTDPLLWLYVFLIGRPHRLSVSFYIIYNPFFITEE